MSSSSLNKSAGWFVVLIAAAVAIGIGFLLPLLEPRQPAWGKGGPEPNLFLAALPSILLLAGLIGTLIGLAGVARSRPSWRRPAVVSAVCAGLALVLEAPGTWAPWWFIGFAYAGIWLGGLLGLVAIGTGIRAFVRPMRRKAVDISLAVFGVLAGIPCALWALWILLMTIGGGLGE